MVGDIHPAFVVASHIVADTTVLQVGVEGGKRAVFLCFFVEIDNKLSINIVLAFVAGAEKPVSPFVNNAVVFQPFHGTVGVALVSVDGTSDNPCVFVFNGVFKIEDTPIEIVVHTFSCDGIGG